jgi:hypothetical protein
MEYSSMKKPLLALLILPLSIASAYADDSPITVSGFGSAAITSTNSDKAEFVRYNQIDGASSSNATTGVDSVLGLQATAKVNDWLSVTGQGIVRKDNSKSFVGEVSWAFAKARINSDLSVRVGRIGLPVYGVSDYINVGYANTMLRSPVEMYSQAIFTNLDGVDLVWSKSLWDTSFTTQVGYGKSKRESYLGGNIHADHLVAFNVTAEHGPVTMRFSRAQAKLTYLDNPAFNSLYGALSATGFKKVADDLAIKDKDASFTSVGANLDWKDILVQSEFAKRKSDSYASDTTSWYVMTGYRVGKFVPYYTHSVLKQDSAKTTTAIPHAGPALPLALGVDSALTQSEQTTDSIGVRWDFHKSAALKLQADHVRPQSAGGTFVNKKPGFTGNVNVLAASIDFTF